MYFGSDIWFKVAGTVPEFGSNPFVWLWDWLKYILTWAIERSFDLTMAMGVPSYALGIFFFTIVIKLLLQPAMTKQMRSARQMSKLQPLLQDIQKRYGSNKQRMQQEQMKLYQEKGVSPFAGCLPVLLQMPILFALFQSLRLFDPAYPEYYTFFWVEDLSIVCGQYPGLLGWVLPVIVGAATFLQQYLAITNRNDRTQKMMLYMMPVMFGFFTRSFPAFLALYWTYYSLVGAAIQLFLNKRWAIEDAREEEARAAREEEEKRQKKLKKAGQKGKEFVEEDSDELKDDNIVTVGGVDYILPPGYTLRKKKVRAHPYSDEEETITVAVMPDGREKPVASLKKNEPPMPSLSSFGFGFGQGKKK